MSEELHKDSFEDFLKKSLKNYEEAPPDKSWEHIAAQRRVDLEQDVVPKRNWRSWLMAASIALFFMALLGQHVYFSKKIDTLETVLQENSKDDLKKIEATPNFPTNDVEAEALVESPTIRDAHNSKVEKKVPNKNEVTYTPTVENNFNRLNSDQAMVNQNVSADFIKNKNELVLESERLEEFDKEEIPSESQIEIVKEEAISLESEAGKERNQVEFKQLSVMQPSIVVKDFTPSLKPMVPVIADLGKRNSRVDISAFAGVVQVNSKSPVRTSSGGSPSPYPQNIQPTRPNITAFQTGLNASIHLSKKMRLRTGLSFEKQSIDRNFCANLKYKDGKHHGLGGSHSKHDFSFDINSGSSSLEVEIRAEDDASGTSWSPDDEITFKVNSKHNQQSYFVPIQFGYEIRKGKWTAGLFAGPNFQIIEKDELSVNGFEVRDHRLRIDLDKTISRDKENANGAVFLHGTVALNLAYSMTPRLRLGVEPSYSKSFLKGPDLRRLGLTASVNYTL